MGFLTGLSKITNIGGLFFDAYNSFRAPSRESYQARLAHDKDIALQREINAENLKYQKEFAQHGISWRVDDARQAGLHPLAALGAQVTSFSPSFVGPGSNEPIRRGNGRGDDFARLSQNLKLALDKDTREIQKLKIEDAKIDVATKKLEFYDLLRHFGGKKEESINDHDIDPSNVSVKPSNPTAMGTYGFEAGISPFFKYSGAPGGWVFPTPTQDNAELISEGNNPVKMRYWRDWVSNAGSDMKAYLNPHTAQGIEWRKFLVSIRPTTHADGTKLGIDEEYRYKPGYGFKLFKKKPGTPGYFYVDKHDINNLGFARSIRVKVPKDLRKIDRTKYKYDFK